MNRLLSGLAACGLLIGAAGCGSDAKDSTASTAAPASTAATSRVAGAASSTTAPSTAATTGSTASTDADAFPVTIEHKYGSITIPSAPERVVSVGFTDQDWLLALGVTPIAIRDWYGDQPYATWPWAQPLLGDAKPTVLPSTELNFEQIAALDPDLIVGVSSGMTDSDYAKLSAIAPTVAQPKEFIDYGTPWDATTELIGKAVGKSAEAAEIVEHVEGLYAEARAAHPEFAGKTASVDFFYNDMPGAYATQDGRSRIISDLGFTIPKEFDELAGSAFYFSVSNEDISKLDTDVMVWLVSTDAELDKVAAIPLRSTTRAYKEGRELATDAEVSGAFSFGSPLSIEYALEEMVPELALAVDGDPSTAVPSAARIGTATATSTSTPATSTTAAAAGAGMSADEQAAADAFAKVYDSRVAFADKSANIAEPDVVATAAEAYAAAGSAMGGISLKPTAVTITGDTATVTYDVLFGTATAYSALTDTIERVDGTWTVATDKFCGFLTQARVPCP